MTTSEDRTGSLAGSLTDTLKNNPAVSRLGDAAKDYARARGTDAVQKIAGRFGNMTDSLNKSADEGGFAVPAVQTALRKISEGDNPVKAALSGVGAGIKEKVSGAFGRQKSGGAGGNKKFMDIIEDITVGVPVNVAYDQWTQFQEFASFMKGVESVDQTDEVSSTWRVKVAKSRRNFKSTITEQIPDRRIAWTAEGPKGTTKGVVTFHPLVDDLTQVLLVMEYYPQGLFEKTGNIWRAQGRRARLDLKHFRRFVMMRGEATGSWRGEIRDAEVVRGPDEEEEEQDRSALPRGSEGEEEEPEERPETAEDYGEEEPEEEDEEYEDEGYEEAEPEEEPEEDEDYEERPRRNGRREPARAGRR